MRYKNSTLEFVPSSIVTAIVEPCPFKVQLPSNQQLLHISHYRVGKIFTDKGNEITTLKLIHDAFDLELVPIIGERKPLFGQFPHTKLLDHLNIPHNEFVPHYNCFGYCFAESLYRIPDPTQILIDEYVECDENESSIVVSFEKGKPVHAGSKNLDKYIAKSGVMALEKFVNYYSAMAGIPHDNIKFYKIQLTSS